MHVLITRPEDDAQSLASPLEKLGLRVSLAPLIRIAFVDVDAECLNRSSGLIVTSRNALRALEKQSLCHGDLLTRPIFCVGEATATYARDLGFQKVISGYGDGKSLLAVMTTDPHVLASRSSQLPLVHVVGDHLAFDIAKSLSEVGVATKTCLAYRSLASDAIDDSLRCQLERQEIDAVVLMSPRSTTTWLDIIANKPGIEALKSLTHVCLSEAVAAPLQTIHPTPPLRIARKPRLKEIVALIKALADESPDR